MMLQAMPELADRQADLVWGSSEQIDAISFPESLSAVSLKHTQSYFKHGLLPLVQNNLELDSFKGSHCGSRHNC